MTQARAVDPLQSGVIPYREVGRDVEVLLITSRSSGAWTVPKGLITPESTALDSACREAWEEAGVHGTAAPEPLGSYSHVKWRRTIDVPLYPLRVESMSERWPERHSRRRRWMPLEEAASAVENPGLREVIRRLPAALAVHRKAGASAMKGEAMKSPMKARVTFDTPKVPVNRGVKIRCLLKIDADSPGTSSRRPLNIGVVLDRSGSMQGAKIHSVREAAKALADKLGADDVFSLTVFDHDIETIVPPRRMREGLGSLRMSVDGIWARGNTNLCGGYQAGCENVLGRRENGALDRVILLTDGLANAGITDPAAIAALSSDMAERGIVTSTIGVGADYSEVLLGRMAEAGGGNTYFLQSAIEIDDVLEEELGGLLSLAAEGLRVRFEPGTEGVRAVQLNAYRVSSDGAWVLGDVYGAQSKILVLDLDIPPMPLGTAVWCGTLHLASKVTSEGGMKELSESLPLDIDVVLEPEFAAQAVDTDVTVQAVELIAAAARVKAWEMAARGDFAGAAKALSECARGLESVGVRHPAIAKRIDDLRTEARKLGEEMEAYYTPMMKKSMYHEAFYMARAKHSHLGSMRSRHAAHAENGCHSYPVQEVNGRFIVEIGSNRYVIDTGRPRSIGDGSPILVGSRSFDLASHAGLLASIARDVGATVSGVLGADILGHYDAGLGGGFLVLHESPRPLPGRVVKADFGSGIPVLAARIGGVDVSVALSTGHRTSILRADVAAGGDLVGREVVTIAGVGTFETEMRRVDLRLGEVPYAVQVGTLPQALEAAAPFSGLAGVLGADFLSTRSLFLSARQGIVTFGPGR